MQIIITICFCFYIKLIKINILSIEILLLKQLIVNQVCYLTDNLPLTDNVDVNLRFLTDQKRFEKAITETFGRFQTQKEFKQTVSCYSMFF